MDAKNDVEVIINGKQYTLSGNESSEYLQKVAVHINEKYNEFKKQEWYGRLDQEMKSVLLGINLSDDYFKAQDMVNELKKDSEEMEKELFEMKHELISMQTQIKELEEKNRELQREKEEAEHKIIRLETELEKDNK